MSNLLPIFDVIKVNLPNTVGFVLAVLLSFVIGGMLTDGLCDKWARLISKHHKVPLNDPYGGTGGLFGRLERILFIYAILTQQSGLLTTWIILKAFFNWIEWDVSKLKEDEDQRREKWAHYHLYCGGSLISIGVGIAFGEFGRFVAMIVSRYQA